MLDKVLDSKVIAIIALLTAIVMLVHTVLIPSAVTLAVTVLVMSYFGLVGLPALIKKNHVKD